MFGWFIVTSLQFTAVVGGALVLMNIIGANIYDLREINQKRQQLFKPHSMRYKNRRHISVLITTHNDQNVIAGCINSLLKSSYRKFEIIVVDNASEDQTTAIVKLSIAQYPKRRIKLYAKRKASNRLAGVLKGYQEYCSGELVLVLDAADEIDKHALANAVRHFNADPRLAIINPKYVVEPLFSSAGLFQKYQTLLIHTPKKLSSISNSDYIFEDKVIFRRDVFLTLLKTAVKANASSLAVTRPGNKLFRTYYAANVIIRSAPVTTFRSLLIRTYTTQISRIRSLGAQRQLFFSNNPDYTKFLTWLRLPFAVCLGLVGLLMPVLLTYFLFLAVDLHEPTLLIVSWAIVSIFLVFAIWGEEQMKIRQKAVYSLGIPLTYGLFYVLSFLQFFAIVRSLFWADKKPVA